eukprot:gene10619-biopygen18316
MRRAGHGRDVASGRGSAGPCNEGGEDAKEEPRAYTYGGGRPPLCRPALRRIGWVWGGGSPPEWRATATLIPRLTTVPENATSSMTLPGFALGPGSTRNAGLSCFPRFQNHPAHLGFCTHKLRCAAGTHKLHCAAGTHKMRCAAGTHRQRCAARAHQLRCAAGTHKLRCGDSQAALRCGNSQAALRCENSHAALRCGNSLFFLGGALALGTCPGQSTHADGGAHERAAVCGQWDTSHGNETVAGGHTASGAAAGHWRGAGGERAGTLCRGATGEAGC